MSTVFLVAAPIDAQVRARGERVGDDDRKGLRRHKGDSMVPMKEGSGISGRTAALSCLVLSCLVLFLQRVPLEGFFWRMPQQAYTVPCGASHPHGQGAQVLCT
jgi:hypothetical protein